MSAPCAVCGTPTRVGVNQFHYCPDHLAIGVVITVTVEAARIGMPMALVGRVAYDLYPKVLRDLAGLS